MVGNMDKSWFDFCRFGLFIHFGLYSLPARHEWVKYYEKISDEEYYKYFNMFNPDLFDPYEWADIAFDGGMRYFVITTKHHEGFCLWDSALTDYKVTNTPYGKDIIKPLVSAFREKGFKVGLYYSLQDWHHPHYTIDHIHPLRDLPKEEACKENSKRNLSVYREYLHGQVKELMTSFGEINEVWFDNSVKYNPDYPYFEGKGREAWGTEELIKIIRNYQPNILINDRLDGEFDFKCPETYMPDECVKVKGQKVRWEVCQSLNNSWGYYRNCSGYKSPHQLISLLAEAVSKGGNLLLNIGPTGRGEFEPKAKESLKALGKWMHNNSDCIYGCTEAPSEFSVINNILTYNPKTNRLYIILINYPNIGTLKIKGDKRRVEYAAFLGDNSEITIKTQNQTFEKMKDDTIYLNIPVDKPKDEVPVVELFLKDRF
ncbi:MAG: alpha-L-fucosidase [Abditibacteriota bacterium]|nr:alpha-L-fucosidase [Abditibacteriota bacterium]